MKLKLFSLLLSLIPYLASAQEASSSYNILRLTNSSHNAALGGQNISIIEDAPTAGWNNPALYTNVSDMSIGLDFMTYLGGSSWMGAQFIKALGERHTLAVNAQYMNYGSIDETDDEGNEIGSFRSKDIVIGGGYSYLLSDRWSGGANVKFLVSNIASYSAIAVALDLGLNYYNEETDFSISTTLQNIGTQLKAYDNGARSHLPFSVNVGLTKGMAHLPVRFHVTMTDITRWKSSYYTLPESDSKKLSFTKKALNHFVVGLDILPTDRIYLSLGYNFRRAYELKASGSSHWAGISAGAGINIKRIQFGLSYSKYHQVGNSIMVNASFKL